MKSFKRFSLILLSLIFMLIIFTGCGENNPSITATPVFSLASGTYMGAQQLTITNATAGATIYYTTNGNDPITFGTEYTKAISITSNMTIKSAATKSGWEDSAVTNGAYIINYEGIILTPAFSLPSGTYTGAQQLTITNATAGTTIYYTTNGDDPITSGIEYTNTISVTSNMTIKAAAKKTGGTILP